MWDIFFETAFRTNHPDIFPVDFFVNIELLSFLLAQIRNHSIQLLQACIDI